MIKVLVVVQEKGKHPELTKPQLLKMIGISDSRGILSKVSGAIQR